MLLRPPLMLLLDPDLRERLLSGFPRSLLRLRLELRLFRFAIGLLLPP